MTATWKDGRPKVGIVGYGAFGRLMARHVAPFASLCAYDPSQAAEPGGDEGASQVDLPGAAACPIVVLAVPVSGLGLAVDAIAPHLRPGTLVIDVGSVKTIPVEIMKARLPDDVEILATHPLFGPQSAAGGIRGLKIAVCPVRGTKWRRVGAFLRKELHLNVIVTTPEAHDRAAAVVQGLTHVIAKVLMAMEPLPDRMTTRSFDLIMEAVDMVRFDAPGVFDAIERSNPYAAEVRHRFFMLGARLEGELAGAHGTLGADGWA